jgi:hypothetical protein
VFLLLGDPTDPCLTATRGVLVARGRACAIVGNPFAHPSRTIWRFGTHYSDSRFMSGRPLFDDDDEESLEGVLVRWLAPSASPTEEWRAEDLAYNHSETQAAVLGWLWGLGCPVIDRPPAWLWYHAKPPISVWGHLLRDCGLPPLDAILTDDTAQIEALLRSHGGVAYSPLTGGGVRHLAGPAEAEQLARLVQLTPLHLTPPHLGAWRACLIGGRVVWDDGTPAEAQAHDGRLQSFASAAGISFVELIIAPLGSTGQNGPRTVDVQPLVRFTLFGTKAQSAIAVALADALLAAAGTSPLPADGAATGAPR